MENRLLSPVHKFIQISEGEWILPGSTLLTDVSALLSIEFEPQGRYKTIAGFIMTELGYLPNEGDQLRKFGYTFTVQTKERLRIVEVRIENLVSGSE